MHGMWTTVNELHAMLKLHEQTLPKKDDTLVLHAIRACRIQKKDKNKKLQKAAKGYPKETMGYYLSKNKVIVARNAAFFENSLITQEVSGSLEDLELIQDEDTHPSENTSLHHDEDEQEIDEPQSDAIPVRSSTWTRNALDQCSYT
nr:zinc finger, CCHC-type [Tanacetum cinerariifolium]